MHEKSHLFMIDFTIMTAHVWFDRLKSERLRYGGCRENADFNISFVLD